MLRFLRKRQKIISFHDLLVMKEMDHYHNTIYNFLDPKTKESIIYVKCKPNIGQIGILDVMVEYRRQGLGKETIKYLGQKWKSEHKLKTIWVSCSKDHYYWSKLHKFHYKQNIHASVNSDGYYKTLDE